MSKNKTVYLAGAISKKEERFCRDWRNIIKEKLQGVNNIKFLDPVANKDLDKKYNSKDIYTEDISMVRRADIIIAELLLGDYPHVGTAMELQDAFFHDKEIIIWGDKHRGHYFVEYIADQMFGDDELYILISYLKENI